jgi:hypothetical protein
MILLDAELENAEASVRRGAERALDRGKEAFGAERGNVAACAQRHVGGTARDMGDAPIVPHVPAAFVRLASGSVAGAAPCPGPELQLSISPPHLEFGRKLS